MQSLFIDMLECPACRGGLAWDVHEQAGDRIETAEARCARCGAVYPVREGIGVFLTPDLRREDMWEQVDEGLLGFLRSRPEIENQLLGAPLESLSPADQFYRGLALEAQGDYTRAQAAFDRAQIGLYTPEYLICHESQLHYVQDRVAGSGEPVVDLASGRGELVQVLAREGTSPVLATDFSPRVLRRDQGWLAYLGLAERVSLLACDARRTPFKTGSISSLTTNLGLANIREPQALLKELRRAVAGELLAITHFFPEEDQPNRQALADLGLADLAYRESAAQQFRAAGWRVELVNVCQGRARPTPVGQILAEAGIDSLPVAETTLEWATLIAS